MNGPVAAQLAAAVEGMIERKGASTPTVRRADWQTAVVTAVGVTAGTVDIGDIRARRLETYQNPTVGDVIMVTQSGAGNWLAIGRTSTGVGTAWASIPLAAGFTTPHAGGFGVAQYRVITVHGTTRVELRGTADPPAALTAVTAFSTALPAAARPSVIRTWTVRRNYSLDTKGSVAMEVSTGGVLSVYGSVPPNTTTWFALDGSHYDL